MKKLLCLLLAACLLGSVACESISLGNSDKPIYVSPEESKKSENSETPGVKPNPDENYHTDDLDMDLFRYIASQNSGNFMISPLSFRYALGLLLAGATGQTKTELLNALGVSSEEEYIATFSAMSDYLAAQKAGLIYGQSALSFANSIWRSENFPYEFKQSYVEKVLAAYQAEALEFTCDNVIKKVNDWVNEKTKTLIPALLPDNYNTKNIDAILLNALYYKNAWNNPFESYAVYEGDFTTASGAIVQKTFMCQLEHYAYYADDVTELLVMTMEDGFCCVFVLGDTTNLSEKIAKATVQKVRVTIPKISVETSLSGGELVSFLQNLGVNLVFTDYSTTEEMFEHNVKVSDIIQKTKIVMDENGVEAAAVTGIVLEKCTSVENPEPIVNFTANSPYSFFIYKTGDIGSSTLFAGQINQ